MKGPADSGEAAFYHRNTVRRRRRREAWRSEAADSVSGEAQNESSIPRLSYSVIGLNYGPAGTQRSSSSLPPTIDISTLPAAGSAPYGPVTRIVRPKAIARPLKKEPDVTENVSATVLDVTYDGPTTPPKGSARPSYVYLSPRRPIDAALKELYRNLPPANGKKSRASTGRSLSPKFKGNSGCMYRVRRPYNNYGAGQQVTEEGVFFS